VPFHDLHFVPLFAQCSAPYYWTDGFIICNHRKISRTFSVFNNDFHVYFWCPDYCLAFASTGPSVSTHKPNLLNHSVSVGSAVLYCSCVTVKSSRSGNRALLYPVCIPANSSLMTQQLFFTCLFSLSTFCCLPVPLALPEYQNILIYPWKLTFFSALYLHSVYSFFFLKVQVGLI